MDPTGMMELIEKHGLGVALAVGIFVLAVFMIKHIIKNSDSILQAYREDQANWNKTINNHLSYVAKSLEKTAERLDSHEEHANKEWNQQGTAHTQMLNTQNQLISALITRIPPGMDKEVNDGEK